MPAMLLKTFPPRRIGVLVMVSIPILAFLITSLVITIIQATHSDSDLSEFVQKLLPAGNCLCETSTVFDCRLGIYEQHESHHHGLATRPYGDPVEEGWSFQHGRDDLNYGLNEHQCNVAFPGLFEEVFRAVKMTRERQSNITAAEVDAIRVDQGMVRAMIINRKLRILEVKHTHPDHRKKAIAVLYSIYRAISTDGRPVPDVEFVFSVDDMVSHPAQPIWTLARRAQDHNLWLIPDFGFWSWDLEDMGTLDDVSEQVIRDEAITGWEGKIQKLMWRGKLQMLPRLRRALLDAARDKPWSDVAGLIPSVAPKNYVGVADQCKYMFLAHVEGRSYSGSLKYRQLCHSVIIIHRLQWIQHHHYLLVANGTEQNYVEVDRDFSDLEEKMEYLIAHPEEARRIADNSVKTFRERYFAPAADACYWRMLIHGWAASSFEPAPYDDSGRPRGMRFENFAVLDTPQQMEWKWDRSV